VSTFSTVVSSNYLASFGYSHYPFGNDGHALFLTLNIFDTTKLLPISRGVVSKPLAYLNSLRGSEKAHVTDNLKYRAAWRVVIKSEILIPAMANVGQWR
jgi:hypothetical protein